MAYGERGIGHSRRGESTNGISEEPRYSTHFRFEIARSCFYIKVLFFIFIPVFMYVYTYVYSVYIIYLIK